MTEKDAHAIIKELPIGAKLQLIKKTGEIVDVQLANHDTSKIAKKQYDDLTIPELPPALIVQGQRMGTYRIALEDIVKISHVG